MPAVTDDPFEGLEPAAFWRHFKTLIAIPRPTYEEEAAVAHVIAWAESHGFATDRDATGNLVVRVPATAGREGAPAVILQGHLDIVCERDPDSPYDPREGRIGVVRDGDWLRADGTTLGADNGVAIAAMQAIAEDPDAVHGPLELLMTVDEEVGMSGALQLDPALISGTVLLNLDSEEDASLTVGCAGGADTLVTFRGERAPADGQALRVSVGGCLGGHSGGDIALGRANAIKLLASVLRDVPGLRVAAFDGGNARNAIPRDAAALVVAGDDGDARALIERNAERARDAYRTTDPGVRVTVAPDGAAPGAWSESDSRRLLALVDALPVGPLRMSPDFPGAVETSTSVGRAETDGDAVRIGSLSRSANDALMPDVLAQIGGIARLAGADCEVGHVYPGWRPDFDSRVLAVAKSVHERLFGAPPEVLLTHGGLEAAVIAARRPGIDPISFGPEIRGPHAPGERVHAGSAARFMRLLAGLLDELSR
jgi:dipeptidase D